MSISRYPTTSQSSNEPGGNHSLRRLCRHVSVEAGIRAIGAEAWQSCRHLRVVRMPSTVVRIADNTFRGCQLLNSITVPGCIEFGYKAFADCCSLQWIHANGGGANQFKSASKFGHHLFRDCINLATFVLLEDGRRQELQTQDEAKELPPGCLSSTGIVNSRFPSAGCTRL